MATLKDRLGDGKINTGIEMIEDQEEKLWETNPMEALRSVSYTHLTLPTILLV